MDLARACGVSRTTISRIELGRGGLLAVRTLEQVATALGARVRCQLDWNGEAMDRLLDEAHARLVERIVRWLDRSGWQSSVEVSFNVFGERRSVDVLALHPPSGCLLVVEAKTVVPDLQAMLTSLDRKARLGIRIAGEQGWKALAVSRLLVISEARTARRRVAAVEARSGELFPTEPRRFGPLFGRRIRDLMSLGSCSCQMPITRSPDIGSRGPSPPLVPPDRLVVA